MRKLYTGKKRYAKRLLGRRAFSKTNSNRYLQLIQWALTVRVGDYIGTCEGNNRKVAKIEIEWTNEGWFNRCKLNKTNVITEVAFTNTHGTMHYCPGGGCAFPAETPEQINAYLWESAENTLSEAGRENLRHWLANDEVKVQKVILREQKILEAIKSGKGVVDEFGELLPEFERLPDSDQE